ncbi:MAG: heparinase II/III family protein [Alphaproteobacteria bacterium]
MTLFARTDLRQAMHCAGRIAGARLASVIFRLPFYHLSLAGRVPPALRHAAPDPWPGTAAKGAEIVAGNFTFAGETVAGDLAAWEGKGHWAEAFHAFEWLRDLRALGGDPAHQRARKLVKDWIVRHEKWSKPAWRGDILGRRLASWIAHYDFFAAGADDAFREQVNASLARQTRHLARVLPAELDGAALLFALKGLVLSGLALPGFDGALSRGIRMLTRELPRQVLPDGGHFERCPSLQLFVLRDLVDLRGALLAAQGNVPNEIQNAIDRMAPMLRFFRLGDGGLALFNGGFEEQPWLIDLVLSRSESKGKPLAAAPHSGFQRLSAGRFAAVLDSGPPIRIQCARDILDCAHAGTLSFEFAAGKDRVIVNCGAHWGRQAAWSRAARATAAHSTMIVEDTNSSEVFDWGLKDGPRTVLCRRSEREDGAAVEASHDGYAALFGLRHRRRLQLLAEGQELRGEDCLIAIPGKRKRKVCRFAIRFHLHPDSKASLLQDGKNVLIKLPSGAGMRFAAEGGDIAIEDSVYLGNGELRKSHQIVVSGSADPDVPLEAAIVSWTLTKVG